MFLLSVIKRKNVVEMHVDTDGNYTIGSASSTDTMTKDPLYVGGIPGEYIHYVLVNFGIKVKCKSFFYF